VSLSRDGVRGQDEAAHGAGVSVQVIWTANAVT
jgi:hypothetical protein